MCIRIMTRILPFIFEQDNSKIEKNFFWKVFGEKEEKNEPLGKKLIEAAIDLMFVPGFSLPLDAADNNERVFYTLW